MTQQLHMSHLPRLTTKRSLTTEDVDAGVASAAAEEANAATAAATASTKADAAIVTAYKDYSGRFQQDVANESLDPPRQLQRKLPRILQRQQ